MKRYRCPKGHEWEYKDRVSVQVNGGLEQVGYILHPCPVCWTQALQSLPNGEEIAPCEHCWHETGQVTQSPPVQYLDYCCRCGMPRTRGEFLRLDPALHGPYYRKGQL